MGSKRRIAMLQGKVLQAAALGSVNLLRTLLRCHAKKASHKEQHRQSRKRRRDEDERKSASRESHRQKTRSRKAERRDQRESERRGGARKRKEVELGFTSDEDSENSEEGTRHSKRARLGDDVKFSRREAHGESKRSRKAEESDQRGKREADRRGSNRNRKEAREWHSSDSGVEDSDARGREEFRNPKSESQGTEGNRNGSQERQTSQGTQSSHREDHSSEQDDRASSGRESDDLSKGTASDSEEEILFTSRSRRKAAAFRETVRSIVNCRDGEGRTPLHHACQAGSEDMVKYLISKGASVHARDSLGETPLHIAARLGPISLVAILEDADADMEACNDEGVTPSDILGEKQAAASRKAKIFNDPKKWYGHLAEELSDNEEPWWGATEWNDSERPDWDDPLLERMAESRQGRGLYNDEPFSLRDFLRAERNKTEGAAPQKKAKRKGFGRTGRPPPKHEEERGSEEVVIGPAPRISIRTQSYSRRWKTFSESYDLCLSYSSVPFPVEEGAEESLRDVLLQGVSDPALQRKELRKEMLKWHPDKFLQKFGPKLQGPDHDRIVARVNGISEAIHQLYKNMTAVK